MSLFYLEHKIEGLAVLITLILAFVFIFMEVRKERKLLWLRISLLIISIISLFFIYHQPYIQTEKPKKSVILTSSDSSRTYDKQYSGLERIFYRNDQLFYEGNLATWSSLPFVIDTLYIDTYFSQLDHRYFRTFKAISRNEFSYNSVDDAYSNQKVSLYFDERNSEVGESLVIVNQQDTIRSVDGVFNFTTGSPGLYRIDYKGPKYEFSRSLHVKKRPRLKIYIHDLYADIELKYLMSFLKNEGHQVLRSTKISKDRFLNSRVNLKASILIDDFIKQSDILISDVNGFKEVLARYGSDLLDKKGILLRILEEGETYLETPKFEFTAEIEQTISERDYLRYVVKNSSQTANAITANYASYQIAENRISLILSPETYKIKILNEEKIYDDLWRKVLYQSIVLSDDILFFNDRFHQAGVELIIPFWARTKPEGIHLLSQVGDTIQIEMLSDRDWPQRYMLKIPQLKEGLYRIYRNNKLENAFLVNPGKQSSEESVFNLQYNRSYLNWLGGQSHSFSASNRKKGITIWFLISFITSIALLWLIEKWKL